MPRLGLWNVLLWSAAQHWWQMVFGEWTCCTSKASNQRVEEPPDFCYGGINNVLCCVWAFKDFFKSKIQEDKLFRYSNIAKYNSKAFKKKKKKNSISQYRPLHETDKLHRIRMRPYKWESGIEWEQELLLVIYFVELVISSVFLANPVSFKRCH